MNPVTLYRTTSADENFRQLVLLLDKDLAVRNGEADSFFAQYNLVDQIQHVVLAYDAGKPVGCGAMKEFSPAAMEIKRMYVLQEYRGRGIATLILKELEKWAAELAYTKCVLETGMKMPEAISVYRKNKYTVIPNYGQYAGIESSICFEKNL